MKEGQTNNSSKLKVMLIVNYKSEFVTVVNTTCLG